VPERGSTTERIDETLLKVKENVEVTVSRWSLHVITWGDGERCFHEPTGAKMKV